MALYNIDNIELTPRFIEAVNINGEVKKKVKVYISDISISPSIISLEEDLTDDKELKKLITYLKKMCRGSFEYKQYIRHFKEVLEITRCKVFGIDVTEIPVGLEIHHTPFSLESIVFAVLNKKVQREGLPLDPKDIAEEVMKLHFDGKVGLIPLTKTMHEAVHSMAIHVKPS